MTNLERAIKDGYAYITGTDNKQKITYVSSDNHTENYNDPEEKVRAEFWAELIYKYEYPANRIKVEVVIPDRLPTDRADIVVFIDDECKRPYTVVECKKDGVTDAEFMQAIEQGVGNATWVKLRADYVVIIAGGTRRVLDVTDNFGAFEREQNILADLPKAYGKPQEYRFYKGGVNQKGEDASDIAPVAREDLIIAIKKCHQTLWGGGRLSPPTAFGELCKLIFVKISDEQKPRKNGEPYQFQIKTHEPSSKLAERINVLYNEQKVKDPEVFTESIKVDDRVLRTVVSHLEAINLNKTDLDVKGVAFEQFMDGFFKGDFGQYFTPRPIIEFCVKMMKPEQDWDVLDPSCGSGGFLLHALDYMRNQAGDYYEKGTVDYFNYWHDFAAKHLFGIEINDEIARVAKMNMIVHDDGHTNVISHDALESIDKMHDHNRGFAENRFDLILTNPPFGSTINLAEKPYLSTYELGNNVDAKGKKKPRKNQSSEVLFVERIWQFLKPGTGKAAIVLPDGILTNSSMQYVRDFILEKFQLLAVVSLPQCAFAHFGAGVKASVIFVRKRKDSEKPNGDEAIFMAAPELIGYDATGRKTESQLDEIVSKYEEFRKDATPFFA
ncbi:restriction endonuclease subunit M [uncultured Eubacterium sp.]|uniref:restriction endonuclease subunit M n=1 Tax=uncultured Eubacterium sp. TaxID=165185 RepID=UPI0028044F56|nr:restriction endonuclease subunit M [uncultured Eubacterium sp.]